MFKKFFSVLLINPRDVVAGKPEVSTQPNPF